MNCQDSPSGHTHGTGAALDADALAILHRGLGELLEMTEGLTFPTDAAGTYPLPLTRAAYGDTLDVDAVRSDVQARMATDPVSVLESALCLLELYEANRPDTAELIPEDMPFVRQVFRSKRLNGWISVMGSADADAVERAVNRQWQFDFLDAPPRPTGVYVLLNMLARYAFIYGRIEARDAHGMGHFIEDFCPGLLVCNGAMTDLELTLSLAAMKMGVPAVVPADYPFPLGRTVRTDALDEIAHAVVSFANIRRLLDTPDIPAMPDYCDPAHAREKFPPAVTWGETGESFLIVRKGAVNQAAAVVTGAPAGPVGVVVTIDAEPMDAFDRDHIESTIAGKLATMKGVAVDLAGGGFAVHFAEDVTPSAGRIGEVLLAATGHEFPALAGKAGVEIIFDPVVLREMAPTVKAEKRARREEIASAHDDSVEWFIGCTGCSPFAPDHTCILTPDRPPQCGRSLASLKAGALYGYDDMSNIHHATLQAGVNSFQVIDKGRCLDPLRGEWSGVNDHITRMTGGRTRRVQLHYLHDHPHTACGCFRLILFVTNSPRGGVGVMDGQYEAAAADGRTWKDLYYKLAGKQAPGLAGASWAYLRSPRFLQAHGGWDAVVWVSPKVAEFVGDDLPDGIDVGAAPRDE